jgi:hypothetical protein
LHQCAYIGDDSSEELEEMEGNVQESVDWPVSRTKMATDHPSSSNSDNSNGLNQPKRMRRFRNGVTFHAKKASISSDEKLEHRDETESDDVDSILIELIRNIAWGKSRHRAKDGVTKAPSTTYAIPYRGSTESQRIKSTRERADYSSAPTSNEVFEDVLKRLQRLGDRGRTVLQRLNEEMGDIIPSNGSGTGYEDLNILRNMVRDILWEQGESKNRSEGQVERSRRGITLAPASLHESLNMNAEDEDAAIEEVSERI